MANEQDSFLRELNEEIQRERYAKIWQRYGNYVLGAIALLVVSVYGFQLYKSQQLAAAQAAGLEFEKAVKLQDDKKPDDARKAFEAIAATGPSGYATAARLHLAGEAAKAGKIAEALSAYESLANDPSADALTKSFAQLQAASLRLGDADFTEMQNRLTPLAADTSPWRASAAELLGLAAWKAGKFAEARRQLEPLLIDTSVPPSTVERVKVVMARIAQAEVASAPPASAAKPASATPAASDKVQDGGATAAKPKE